MLWNAFSSKTTPSSDDVDVDACAGSDAIPSRMVLDDGDLTRDMMI